MFQRFIRYAILQMKLLYYAAVLIGRIMGFDHPPAVCPFVSPIRALKRTKKTKLAC